MGAKFGLHEERFEVWNANLYDPKEDEVTEKVDLAFVEGTLTELGPNIRATDTAELVVDLDGRWVMPPMVDCHVHPATIPNPERNDPAVDSLLKREGPLEEGQIHANLRETVSSGVLGVREMGTPRCRVSEYAPYRDGTTPPLLTCCVQPVTGTGGHMSEVAYEIDEGTDCQAIARELHEAEAAHMKVANDPIEIDSELLGRLVTAAHNHNIPVACHTYSEESIEMAIRAGCDTIEHSFPPSAELARMAEDNGTVFVPTYYCAEASLLPAEATNIPAESRGHFEWWYDNLQEFARCAVQSDVRIALGTDAGMPPIGFGDLWKEACLLSEAGFSAVEILEAATVTGAEVLGIEDRWIVAKGQPTSLITVCDDPREDLTTLRTASPLVFDGMPLLESVDYLLTARQEG